MVENQVFGRAGGGVNPFWDARKQRREPIYKVSRRFLYSIRQDIYVGL